MTKTHERLREKIRICLQKNGRMIASDIDEPPRVTSRVMRGMHDIKVYRKRRVNYGGSTCLIDEWGFR